VTERSKGDIEPVEEGTDQPAEAAETAPAEVEAPEPVEPIEASADAPAEQPVNERGPDEETEPPEGERREPVQQEEPADSPPAAAEKPTPPRPTSEGRRGSRGREEAQTRIAFIGGTGPEGLGLAMRFARSGNMVYIGSRSEERAEEAVARVKEKVPEGDVFGGLNLEGAERADVVFITVPSDAHESTLTELAEAIGDKVLVDLVVPIIFDQDGAKAIDFEDGSAAQQARRLVPEAKVVSAFHHLDASELQKVDRPMQGDVIVCGDHKGAKKQVMDLVEQIEWVRALDAGPLANARYLENWTVVLVHLNKIYKAHTGVRITGI
jgi:NADPH-dependent F420 reductase